MGGGGGYKPINQSSHKLKKIMIIEKVFSNIEKESEKLYSILLSEDEADLFSEFQKEFTQPKEKKETKLKFGDRLIIRGYKNRGQDYRDEARETWKTGKMGKQQRKGMVAGFVGVNAARSLGKSIENKSTPTQAILGAGISAGIGAGEGYLISKGLDHYRTNKLKKNPKAYEKDIDRINVAEGKMSKEDFAKKYYKK